MVLFQVFLQHHWQQNNRQYYNIRVILIKFTGIRSFDHPGEGTGDDLKVDEHQSEAVQNQDQTNDED